LISQAVPQLGALNNIEVAKTKSSYTQGCRALTWRKLGFLVGPISNCFLPYDALRY